MRKEGLKIRHVVLDVLKPHEPRLSEFALYLAGFHGVSKVDINVEEMDQRTESLTVILNGDDIDFEELREHLLRYDAVIQSLDRVVVE